MFPFSESAVACAWHVSCAKTKPKPTRQRFGNGTKMKPENMKSAIIRRVMRAGLLAGDIPNVSRTRPVAPTKRIHINFCAVKMNVPVIVRQCSSSTLAGCRVSIQTHRTLHRHISNDPIRGRNKAAQPRGTARVGSISNRKDGWIPLVSGLPHFDDKSPPINTQYHMNANNAQDLDAEVIVHGDGVAFAQEIFAGSHKLAADEPVSSGGTGSGPGPYEFLLAALGSCTSITVTMYARRKRWPLSGVTVWLRHSKLHAIDCADCDSRKAILDRITRSIRFGGPLTEDQRQCLLEIANKCPVHRTLTSKVNIMTRLVPQQV